MKKILLIVLIVSMGNIIVVSQSRDRIMYVAVKSTDLKSSAGIFAEKRGVLNLGDAVTLIRTSGNWAEVRTGNSLTGWLNFSSLTSRRITGTGLSSSAGEIALAGKGFSAETEIEYKQNGLDYSFVDRMESIVIPDNELRRFIEEGRLARGN